MIKRLNVVNFREMNYGWVIYLVSEYLMSRFYRPI